MKLIESQTFDMERPLYGERNLHVKSCTFDGPADGESAFKECSGIQIEDSFFNLRYPFWHDHGVMISGSELTEKCRAALWYSDHVEIAKTKLHGIKALRECSDATLTDCDILSAEFGWSVRKLTMNRCTAESEYFALRGESLRLNDVRFRGKYSFQYTKDVTIENCFLDTKDAFWHSRNVTVRNSVVKGEYLAWYSDGLTLINCKIIGAQPLCYCTHLKLIDCEMTDTDLAFEKSHVEATIKTPVVSIKNPLSGTIYVPSVGEIVMDDENAKGKIVFLKRDGSSEMPAGEFIRGAQEAGNSVKRIPPCRKATGFCKGCPPRRKTRSCVTHADADARPAGIVFGGGVGETEGHAALQNAREIGRAV